MPAPAPTNSTELTGDLGSFFRRNQCPCVTTLGAFDGVHAGHRALVGRAAAYARSRDLLLTAVTLSPRPDQVFSPDIALPDLCPIEERVQRLRTAGADNVVVLPFSRAIAQLDAATFVALLRANLGTLALYVGEDFALGRARTGDVTALRELGLEVLTHPLVCDRSGSKLSSSKMRADLRAAERASVA
jgi:riboflavin kinase/FMN adenylyltransferase